VREKRVGKGKSFLMRKASIDMTNSGLRDIQKGGIWRELTTSGLKLKRIKKLSLGVVKFVILYFNVGEKKCKNIKRIILIKTN